VSGIDLLVMLKGSITDCIGFTDDRFQKRRMGVVDIKVTQNCMFLFMAFVGCRHVAFRAPQLLIPINEREIAFNFV
jgi:hypothetical protein